MSAGFKDALVAFRLCARTRRHLQRWAGARTAVVPAGCSVSDETVCYSGSAQKRLLFTVGPPLLFISEDLLQHLNLRLF